MEGSWGRRIFGTVDRFEGMTRFRLMMETREGNHLYQRFNTPTRELERFPETYKSILDMLVTNMEQAITYTKGNQP